MLSFDQICDRRNTDSTKWDRYESRYGLRDVVPLWVADMDFPCMEEVQNAVIRRAGHPVYGYTDVGKDLVRAVIDWESRQHHIEVSEEEIVWNTGVVYGFYTLIEWLVRPEEKVIVQPPVYPPFFRTPESLGRRVVYSPLRRNGDVWEMDLEDFEAKLKADPSIRMFLLCNPHNPVGRCWSRDELEKLLDLCGRYGLYVVSDEIHADIVFPGTKHVSVLACDRCRNDRVILLGSATKTFNLAGLKISYAIVKNPALGRKFAAIAKACGLSSVNLFAMEAMKAAYRHGDTWKDACVSYIYKNFRFMENYLKEEAPEIDFSIPQATYLGWMDMGALPMPENFCERLKREGHVEFQAGEGFGDAYADFLRVNLACPRRTLEEGLCRMTAWLKENGCLT
ncbi:MAG: pyridoxal phosphate-dependent aminotransferase [Lachnospiraceae bacterium]|nr:pyridoxal phosphate-dependent aminotransferase [Lachnospiraceae bacterium]